MRKLFLLIFIANIAFAQGSLIWQKSNTELPGNGYSWSTPLIMDHKFLWAGQDKAFAALDEATGEILWVDSLNFSMGTYDSPVGYDGKVFIGRDDWNEPANNGLFALDAETGDVVWKKLGLKIQNRSSKPIHITNETIFVAGTDTLFCLDINTGAVVWKTAGQYANLLLDYSGNTLYLSRRNSEMIEALNPADGQQIWYLTFTDTENFITGMAYTEYDSKEYLVLTPDWNWNVDSSYIYGIDIAARDIMWKTNILGHTGNGASPAILGDKVFAGTQKSGSVESQNIVAFSLLTGNLIWENPARGSGSTNTPYVIALDGKVYYEYTLDNSYSVKCVSAETGIEIWSDTPQLNTEWPPISWGSPVLYDNKLYLPTDGGGIYCYDAGTVDGQWLMVSGNVYATNSYKPELVTKIEKEENALPADYTLEQNYPNPFNPATSISFSIPVEGNVRLSIYNSIGEEINSLINQNLSAGSYKVNFNAGNLSSGVYFYTLNIDEVTISRKMILLK